MDILLYILAFIGLCTLLVILLYLVWLLAQALIKRTNDRKQHHNKHTFKHNKQCTCRYCGISL